MTLLDVFRNRSQKVHRSFLDAVVEHLTMFVKNQVVCRPIELLIRKRRRLLVVDLVDSILDCLPVLLGLGSLHVGIAHLVTINQKLV